MKRILFLTLILLGYANVMGQDLTFTFANAQITNDGIDDYYDVDVMIQSTVDFKLGSGQLYLTYNTAAFGSNVSTSNNFDYSQPVGSILAEEYGGFKAYKDFIKNDNTTSRVSLGFQQGLGSGSITVNNVTSTPKVLLHTRMKFIDVNEDPMIAFETGTVYLDQFYSACGPVAGGLSDCSGEPGTQLLNDTFDSSNSPDTTAPVITLTGDNPQEIIIGSGYAELGATTDDGAQVTIDSSGFTDAVGSYTITYNATDIVGNVATEITRTVNVVAVLSTEDRELEKITLTPNPTNSDFQILGVSEETEVIIYTINGHQVKQVVIDDSKSIAIPELASGVYFVKITSGNSYKTIKMVKN
ncbi:T9SS type A sorting domain-containing protein [Aquimarina sp. 2201CG5-10]|uniref:T9SS type A sorting domain-containing protein n=1 Tax=Aquimarina callyspongiae TaxID=3098150 RepID=UPI002AB4BC0D|nr:T9SS type A sorting domain-containing protein [Aquimarina sp. 2201CG5-10]MDY8138029.1 T9SS type A sorting domain-containing protein [Aquimarina sp. 2201CG5-10]